MERRGPYTVYELEQGVYHLMENSAVSVASTLVVGRERALLVDTGFGAGNWNEIIASFTSLPYDVVLTHGHADHCSGAGQFAEVWLHPADHELLESAYRQEERTSIWDAQPHVQKQISRETFITQKPGCVRPLAPGQQFPLGGCTAEVVPMPGHTKGSAGILLKEQQILLTGDAANPHFYLFFPYSTSLAAFAEMLAGVMPLPFTRFAMSHQNRLFPKEQMQVILSGAREASLANSAVDPAMEKFHIGTPIYRHDTPAQAPLAPCSLFFSERQAVR